MPARRAIALSQGGTQERSTADTGQSWVDFYAQSVSGTKGGEESLGNMLQKLYLQQQPSLSISDKRPGNGGYRCHGSRKFYD
jgi:hypothetical protein